MLFKTPCRGSRLASSLALGLFEICLTYVRSDSGSRSGICLPSLKQMTKEFQLNSLAQTNLSWQWRTGIHEVSEEARFVGKGNNPP